MPLREIAGQTASFNSPAALPRKCRSCPIYDKAVCAELNPQERDRFADIAVIRRYEAGRTVLAEQASAPFLATISSGVVKLIKTLPDGRRQMIGLQFPSNLIGRAFHETVDFEVIAATDIKVCQFPRKSFERLVRQTPALEHRLLEMTLNELDTARNWMLLLGRKTASERVATFLLQIAKRSTTPPDCCQRGETPVSFELPLTRADIADFLGLTIETVSRQISRLKSNEAITLTDARHFLVKDMQTLAALSGETP